MITLKKNKGGGELPQFDKKKKYLLKNQQLLKY